MNEKQRRRRKILDLIASRPIGKQEALSRALREVGISTTQSTLSKDMKELGVVKAVSYTHLTLPTKRIV